MVIDPSSGYNKNGVTSAGNNAKAKPADTSTETAKAPAKNSGDSVSLSSEAQSMARLEAAVNTAPDTDDARIAQLKQAIENGTYQVDAQAVASKMLAEDQDW